MRHLGRQEGGAVDARRAPGGGAHLRRTTRNDGSEPRAAASAGPAAGPTLQPLGVGASASEVPRGICVRKKSGSKRGLGQRELGVGRGWGVAAH